MTQNPFLRVICGLTGTTMAFILGIGISKGELHWIGCLIITIIAIASQTYLVFGPEKIEGELEKLKLSQKPEPNHSNPI